MEKKPKLQRLISYRLNEFEDLFRQGWTYQMVVDLLTEEGVTITKKYFSQALAKARAKKKKSGSVSPEESPQPQATLNKADTSSPPPHKNNLDDGDSRFQRMTILSKDQLF
ncbi:MAG: hypothetical protein PHF20_01430 [Halothiobacillaceae bacterium]|nr:hypothetical protein [Halothiobacillaceae bacterium]